MMYVFAFLTTLSLILTFAGMWFKQVSNDAVIGLFMLTLVLVLCTAAAGAVQ